MTKDEILKQMKEKFDVSDEKIDEFNKELESNQENEGVCQIDDPDCEACGS